MSVIKTSDDLSDFERFFYDQVRFRNDFFEKPKPKIEAEIRISKWFLDNFVEFVTKLLLAKAAIYITLVLENITEGKKENLLYENASMQLLK